MATSPTARRWFAFLAATAVVVAAAWMVRHRLYGGGDAPGAGGSAAAPAAPAAPANAPAALSRPHVHVFPGMEIYAVDLGVVVEVDLELGPRTVVIRRRPRGSGGGSGGGFDISVTASGAAVASCHGGAALDDLLARISSVRVTRVIDEDEAAALQRRFGAGAATLRIRDQSTLDPKEFRVLFPDVPPPGALLLDGPALYETSLPRELFDRLSAGCEALGRKSDPRQRNRSP